MLQRNRPEDIATSNRDRFAVIWLPSRIDAARHSRWSSESGDRLGDDSLQVEYIRDLTYPSATQHAVAVVEDDGLAGGDAELGGVEFDV